MARNPMVVFPSCLEVYNALRASPSFLVDVSSLARVLGYDNRRGRDRVRNRLSRLAEGRLVASYRQNGHLPALYWTTDRVSPPLPPMPTFPMTRKDGVNTYDLPY